MTKARVDKDNSDYLSKTARPEGESKTAYWSKDSIEGAGSQADANGTSGEADRSGNKQDVYSGGTKKDKTRIADRPMKLVSGETGIGDTGTGLGESDNPFAKVIARRFGLQEDENPGVASSSSTSDNPSLGMMSVNNTDFRQDAPNIKNILEAIALQAADSFELMDENKKVPPAISTQLENCQNIITKFYQYMTSNADKSPSSDPADTPPVQKDTAERKTAVNESDEYPSFVRRKDAKGNPRLTNIRITDTTPKPPEDVRTPFEKATNVSIHRSVNYRKESLENFYLYAETAEGDSFESEPLTEMEADTNMQEMIESGAYTIIEKKLIGNQNKLDANHNGHLDSDDFKKLRGKKTMKEAVNVVFRNILKDNLNADH